MTDVQADEIWGFVGKKEGHKNPFESDDMYLGDAWCFIGIERHTKLVLCFELGKRTETSAGRFMAKLAAATDPRQRFQLTTDGLPAYPFAVGNHLGDRVDYAQLIKVYAQTPEGERRYSPPEPAAEKVVAKQTVEGDHNASYAITGAGNMLVVGSPVSRSVLAPSQARSQKSSYLVYRGIVPEDLLISTWSTTGFTDHECVDAFRAKALLARFENERRGESPSRTGAVIAKLTFHLVSGATRSIDYGVWLNSQFRSVNIGLGETERLVVLIDLGDSLFAVADRRDGGTPFPANDYYQRYPLAPGISSVDIRLVDPPHGTYSISLDVSRDDNGLFSVSARDERRI